MRKKIICLLLMVSLALGFYPGEARAEENQETEQSGDTEQNGETEQVDRVEQELNIYAMYLGDKKKGDSVLLESGGKYLLIDLGDRSQISAVIEQLQMLEVTHLDVMFSHLHTDHTAGKDTDAAFGLKKLLDAGIRVDTLYLPSASFAPRSRDNRKRYADIADFMSGQEGALTIFLELDSEVQLGAAVGKVIGPVNPSEFHPGMYPGVASDAEKYMWYENNCSMAVMFTCGTTRYFTAGDCFGPEADALLERYGSALKSDIMKLNHHGTGNGNSAKLLAAISPSYSFALNAGLTYVDGKTGQWKTYPALNRASRYGMCYLVANERQTMIYHIADDVITLYQGKTLESAKKMTGWQTFCGADGTWRDHEEFYFDEEGQPLSGVNQVGDHYYYFAPGGRMIYGRFKKDGTYTGWVSYDDGLRYYSLSPDKKYAYMAAGVVNTEAGYFYFDENGYKQTSGADEYLVMTWNSESYIMDQEGEVLCEFWYDDQEAWYYFGTDGKMCRGRMMRIDKIYYIFNEKGKLVKSKSGYKLYTFGDKTYVVGEDGAVVTGQCVAVRNAKYYVNAKGVVQKDKLIQIGSEKYYFDKNGKMVVNKKITFRGKAYYCDSTGVAKVR